MINLAGPQNAFPDRLGADFNVSRMLVVDLLHEFELGVWKALFTHLIRVLYSDVRARAWPESPGLGFEAWGSGPPRLRAGPEALGRVRLGRARA